MTYDPGTMQDELIRDEGLRLMPYRCTAGKLSIGVGRNLEDKGISEATARLMLQEDIEEVEADLNRNIPWWRDLTDARQRALVNMGFMGWPKLSEFKKMLAALRAGDYREAAAQALDSKWAMQVGDRALRVAKMIREG